MNKKATQNLGEPQVRIQMFPKDTNALGNIFGGVILSHLDIAAALHARDLCNNFFVTKILREVDFIAPVKVGDLVSCYTETLKIGKTSVTVKVLVEAQRGLEREKIKVTEAEVVMVAIDAKGEPIELEMR